MDLFVRNNIINFSCSFCGSLYQIKGSFVLNFASLFTYKFLIFVLLLLLSGLEAMEAALELEKKVNKSLLDLHKVADSHGDFQVLRTGSLRQCCLCLHRYTSLPDKCRKYYGVMPCIFNGSVIFIEICGVGDEICAYPWKVVVRVSKEVISR